MNFREKVFEVFEDPTSSILAVLVSIVINIMILVSTATFVIETMPSMSDVPTSFWETIEAVCMAGFTIDFIVRSGMTPSHALFWKDSMNWIDFVAIVPFYLEMILTVLGIDPGMLSNLRLIRVLRLARILRIFKQTKSGNMTSVIGTIIASSGAALVIPMYLLALAVVVFASLMYYAERGTPVTCYGPGFMGEEPVSDALPGGGWVTFHQDSSGYCAENAEDRLREIPGLELAFYKCDPYDGFHTRSVIHKTDAGHIEFHPMGHGPDCCYCLPNGGYVDHNFYASIPDALWWSVVTFTTVGYGDKFPVTWPGRIIAMGQMAVGVFFMAMPLTIVGTAFNAAWEGIQDGEHKNLVETHRGNDSKEQLAVLEKWYTFAEQCCLLEEAMISVPATQRLKMRGKVGDLLTPLKESHEVFSSHLHKHFQIFQIPDDLRNPDAFPPED